MWVRLYADKGTRKPSRTDDAGTRIGKLTDADGTRPKELFLNEDPEGCPRQARDSMYACHRCPCDFGGLRLPFAQLASPGTPHCAIDRAKRRAPSRGGDPMWPLARPLANKFIWRSSIGDRRQPSPLLARPDNRTSSTASAPSPAGRPPPVFFTPPCARCRFLSGDRQTNTRPLSARTASTRS